METEKLYYKDAYIKEFEAAVIDCTRCGDRKNMWLTELDRTAFYPEGGGQPSDCGYMRIISKTGKTAEGLKSLAENPAEYSSEYIDNNINISTSEDNKINVFEVHERDGHILHFCDKPIEKGTMVSGHIDWELRFDHMQQHSGEHIVSGMICEAFNCSNVGFHMGEKTVVIDYDAELTEEMLSSIEEKANRYIWENRETVIFFPDSEELSRLSYRSKKELSGAVRIVSFPGADTCACCGTHVRQSAEVGLVKLLSCQKFTKGSRIELVCGKRALEYLSICREQNRLIAVSLAASFDKTYEVVAKKLRELSELRFRLSETEERLFSDMAKEYAGKGNIVVFAEGLEQESLKRLCVIAAKECGGRCAVFSADAVSDKNIDSKKQYEVKSCGRYKYAVKLGENEPQSIIRKMNSELCGRGGGKGGFAQGFLNASERQIRDFFAKLD